jgi:septal ring factor EnvC (AmiA/AmiB activator)
MPGLCAKIEGEVFTICSSKKLLLPVLFVALFLVSAGVSFADYIMNDKERSESLQIIADLKNDLLSREKEYESLKQTNKTIEEQLAASAQKINKLEALNNDQAITIRELKTEKEKIQQDLTGLKKSLAECARRNKMLKVERWLFLIAGILAGKSL